MPDNTDRKRAEEWAIAHLGRMYVSEVPTIVDAIFAFASEVRKEQREKDAQIAETAHGSIPIYERGKIAAAIRAEVEPK